MLLQPALNYNHCMPTTLVIQAGGESRRMGQDKALLPFLGQPLIQRVVGRLAGLADELLVTTNCPADFQFLKLPLVSDDLPGRGALGGLYTALQAARYDCVIVLACDMPFVNPRLLAWQREVWAELAVDALVPRSPGGLEPFHAVYRRSTCLGVVRAALDQGQWRANAWFEQVKIHYLEPGEMARLDPQMRSFQNINTPQEYESALAWARQEA